MILGCFCFFSELLSLYVHLALGSNMNVSDIAMVVDKYGNVLVFKDKGRPINKELQYIKMHGNLN